MRHTFKYDISIVLDPDDTTFGKRVGVVYSAYTGRKLGTVPYNKVLESGHPEEIEDYINSNMKFS